MKLKFAFQCAFMATPVVQSGTRGRPEGAAWMSLWTFERNEDANFRLEDKRIHWKAECVQAEFSLKIHSRKISSKIFSSSTNLSVLQFRSSFCFCRRLNTVPSALRSLFFFFFFFKLARLGRAFILLFCLRTLSCLWFWCFRPRAIKIK